MSRTTDNAGTTGSPMGVPHTFHIPVMGTGFTIDTPIRVAQYGISSVLQIGDDILIEHMRKLHSRKAGQSFVGIPASEDDSRARRITAYLNLLNDIVDDQVEALRAAPFRKDSEITKYFELLPDGALKDEYEKMMALPIGDEKKQCQQKLRASVVPGSIDVNIMTKIDGPRYRGTEELPDDETVAVSALRGFARSRLNSSIVLSAGMNRKLYGYMAKFDDFLPDQSGFLKKRIVLKVSDYRSALIQGKMLAQKGLWVSEYRVESGLNCGGHAFATKGHLLGPILNEFRSKKEELTNLLFRPFSKALNAAGRPFEGDPPPVRITVQGGIGTANEDNFLQTYFEVDGTGWGTPFLLVPEVTNIDAEHLKKLLEAGEDEVYLSNSSPLGVPFWNLKTSASEAKRLERIERNTPGSPCPKRFLNFDTEFPGVPLCRASRKYQKMKLESLHDSSETTERKAELEKEILLKSCLCMDLAANALVKKGISVTDSPAICCGPGIADFAQVATLSEMIDHIYGRASLLANSNRPHMFIRELSLYIDFLKQEVDKTTAGLLDRTARYFSEFRENLDHGIKFYQNMAEEFSTAQKLRFQRDLEALDHELENLFSGPVTRLPDWLPGLLEPGRAV